MKIAEQEGYKVVRFDNPGVAVIAYNFDDNGVLSEIGIVKEKNPHFEGGFTENIVLGTVENDDTSLLKRAALKLKEEGGVEVADISKWSYLGEVYCSKVSPDPLHLFAVDVTGAKMEKPTGDGKEVIFSFEMTPIPKALELKDSILLASFFKLFMQIYKKDFKTT
jgi:8-oxo-dGTP pyrophosphatase MutT (NUDIX family)